jgi:DNA-binding transcriptional LysR family regulator
MSWPIAWMGLGRGADPSPRPRRPNGFREELVLVTALGSTTMSQRLAQGALTVITFRQGCSYRQRLDAEFMTRGWLPYRRLEMGTVEGILGCVGGNVGVTVLPRSVVDASQA